MEESLNKDCMPSEPNAAPKVVPNSLNELPNEFVCQSMELKSTTPIKIPRTVVATIPIRIAPRTFFTTKMAVSTKPITANKIGALSKLANAGTIPPFIVTFVAFPPSTTELEIADWSAEKDKNPAFLIPTYATKIPIPPPIAC